MGFEPEHPCPKYAHAVDHSHLLIPASCFDSTLSELDYIPIGNLKLNNSK